MIQITIPNNSHVQPFHIQILFEPTKIGIGQYDAKAKGLVDQNRSEGTKNGRLKKGGGKITCTMLRIHRNDRWRCYVPCSREDEKREQSQQRILVAQTV